MKSKKDSRVDRYIKDQPEFAQPILSHLRKIARASCPQAEETLRWSQPFYFYNDKLLCGMGTFKTHCKFWVKNWRAIKKDQGSKAQVAMQKMLYIHTIEDLPSDATIKSLLKQSMQLIDNPKPKKPRIVRKKPPVKTPANLMRALRENAKALKVYESFSESHKRHYVEWINEAKTEETRKKRLEKALKAIAAGKNRHWL